MTSPQAGNSEPAIHLDNLVKKFGDFVAVDGVSFDVPQGQSFGLLGPNGAGKSTLIRLLTTLLEPTSGTARVAGHDVRKQAAGVRKSIGVIPQALTSDPDLTAEENLVFYARLYGLNEATRRPKIDELLEAVDLLDWRDKMVGTFSGGMRRRLEIGRSLLHRPKILFLDEPTTGLDPASRIAMWEMIRKIQADSGLTLFLTTHYMEEADQLCERIAIFDHGHVVVMDSPSALKSRLESQSIEVAFVGEPEGWADVVRGLPGVLSIETGRGSWLIRSDDRMKTVPALLTAAAARGVSVTSLSVLGSSLEDVFVQYTGRDLRDSVSKSVRRDVSHLYDRNA